ncbi:MAG: helix-turn-helix domain-containing protein [Nitrospinae bacterium]|nr:helix-turn-helix domain-containing protein [Nitrospinota bacterium]
MKAELNIDTQEIVREITQEVIRELKPYLTGTGKSEDDTLFTVESIARYLQVSPQWVYERVHLKELPYFKIGKFPRFKKSEIDHWLDTLKIPAINPVSRRLKVIK